jgi:predicted DCC family thiol-disulfide oxidoreductase YuxK
MSHGAHVAQPPAKPLMIFDGECGFCSLWIGRWEQMTGSAVDYLPAQVPDVQARFPEIPPERYGVVVHLVETDGHVYSAAEAVFRTMAHAPGHRWALRAYQFSPIFARTTELAYRLVASHRDFFSLVTRWLWGRHVERTTHAFAQWFFLRALGAIYLFAFLSLWGQIDGLIGHDGILPVDRLMSALGREYGAHGIGWDRFRLVPTLCWLSSSDASLHVQCAAGAVLAVALILDLAPILCLVLLWLLYLSLATVGREFLGYQWDNLLLETGFLAIVVTPLHLRPRPPRIEVLSRWAIWLPRLLLFKLMFSSGCVKLASGDPSWRSLTALSFHYQTQPLPTWLAWYANQCPMWFHKTSCALMFAIELLAPFLIFLPRRPRLLGCALLVFFQVLILLTGNYTFFNGLTLALCLFLVDDIGFRRILPRRFLAWSRARPEPTSTRWRGWHGGLTWAVAIAFVPLSLLQVVRSTGARPAWLSPIESVEGWLDPLRTISGYGLFAVMTTERREIVVEGSDDGVTFVPYEFPYKPGDVTGRLRFVAPHQPRLDWQMWFAALGSVRGQRWFVSFCARLLQGSPKVTALLGKNPFPIHPPRFLRAELYEYDFTEPAERRSSGAWWKRERIGEYLPRISLPELGM